MYGTIAALCIFCYTGIVKKINTARIIYSCTTASLCCTLASFVSADTQESPHFQQITGEALQAVFEDTIMLGEYRLFRDTSKSYAYSEHHFAVGTTAYKEGAQDVQKGLWKIVGDDKICYRYPNSENYTQIYCFLVYVTQGCYYKYSPLDMVADRQNTGAFRPRNWDMWTSRAVRKGSGASCAAPMS
jgi:hypothetical protein